MVTRLKDAFDKASGLPEAVQEQLADQLIDDIEGETKWDATLAKSQDLLDEMAARALRARQDRRARAGGFDQL